MSGSPDLSEFQSYAQRYDRRQPCPVKILLDELSAEDAGLLKAALDSKEISNRGILGWLRARDRTVTNSALTNHRHGGCRCYERKS